ncbi:MAG: hypothetical protein AB7F65_02620 [Dehalococcoidia bacterium]
MSPATDCAERDGTSLVARTVRRVGASGGAGGDEPSAAGDAGAGIGAAAAEGVAGEPPPVACARREAGVLSSIDARRRTGAGAVPAELVGVTVTDCERTLRPRSVDERAAMGGAGGGPSCGRGAMPGPVDAGGDGAGVGGVETLRATGAGAGVQDARATGTDTAGAALDVREATSPPPRGGPTSSAWSGPGAACATEPSCHAGVPTGAGPCAETLGTVAGLPTGVRAIVAVRCEARGADVASGALSTPPGATPRPRCATARIVAMVWTATGKCLRRQRRNGRTGSPRTCPEASP